MTLFCDTSALVELYIPEDSSRAMQTQAAAATAESLAIKRVEDATPTLASVPPDDAIAAVLAKGAAAAAR